jgi:hypothetical protein
MLFAMTRLRGLGAIVIGSALAVLLALAAFSPAAQANHSWGKYHWARQSNPFTLKLADNVSSTWEGYLATTSTDWSVSSVLDTTVVPGTTTTCTPTFGIGRVEVCNAAYGTNGWLGLAQIWVSRRHIVAGTTKVNDTYFSPGGKYDTDAWRQMVMCQEVGHTFGLDHQDENFNNTNLGTCMDYTSDPSALGTNGFSNEQPNQHDYDQLGLIYSHIDKTTTVSPPSAGSTLPPTASRGDLNSRAQWGRKIHESPNGQLELYERDFGGGKKMFTFVIRA